MTRVICQTNSLIIGLSTKGKIIYGYEFVWICIILLKYIFADLFFTDTHHISHYNIAILSSFRVYATYIMYSC